MIFEIILLKLEPILLVFFNEDSSRQPFFFVTFSKGITIFIKSFEYSFQPFLILLFLSFHKK